MVHTDAALRARDAGKMTKIAKLLDLLNLPAGWDSYSGKPINALAVTAAIDVIYVLDSEPSFVPTSDGGIQLECHRRGIDFEVTVSPLGQVVFDFEQYGTKKEPVSPRLP